MKMYWFKYSDGSLRHAAFDSKETAAWFAHNEGDHLIDWGEVK